MKKIYSFQFFFILLLIGCQEKGKGIDSVVLDDVLLNINSAGIGYHVINLSKLDSSNGLNYIVALSATNEGKAPISFNEESFTLFNSQGEKMPAKTDFGVPSGAINLNAITTTIGPDETKEIMLIFSVKEHGVYRFQIISPTTGSHNWIDLPSS
jgi:hypothetical protein